MSGRPGWHHKPQSKAVIGKARRVVWTPDMDAALRTARLAGKPIIAAAEIVGVDKKVAANRMDELGLPRHIDYKRCLPVRWTADDKAAFTADWLGGMTLTKIAEKTGRTWDSLETMRRTLGLPARRILRKRTAQ